MAGASDPLRAQLASYDEAALIALSNKGLLRRAAKDLEKEAPSIASDADSLVVRVGEESVTLDERGPKHARCTCPAQEICRHILTAILFLQQQPVAAASDPAALEAELAAIDMEQLGKYAGKRLLREAVAVLADEPEPAIEAGDPLRVEFPDANVEVRFFAGSGLEGALTTSRSADAKKFVAAALIALQRSRGGTAPVVDDGSSVLEEAAGAPRTRSEVIGSARALFEEMIDGGLAHLTEVAEARLTTLSISAIGVNLPRLALDLKRIADGVAAQVARLAQADEARLFGEVARAYALASALASAGDAAPAELVGWHRTRYREIGSIELEGLGAYAWSTGSGYVGLTVLFREVKSGEWHSWSDARPAQYAEYSPEERYRAPGPWDGMRDPALASRVRFKLFHARRNERRRLSASSRCKAQVIAQGEAAQVELELRLGDRVFADFARLREHVESQRPAGLGTYDPIADLVVVKPSRFGARAFDEIRQSLVYELHDAAGRMVPLVSGHPVVIEALEKLDPGAAAVWGVMGRAIAGPEGLRVVPIALYRKDGIYNLGLDAAETSAVAAASMAASMATARVEEEAEVEAMDSASAQRIRGFEAVLEEVAEIGRGALHDARRRELLRVSRSLDGAGLPLLAGAARALSGANAAETAERVLRGRYLTGVHRELAG